MNKKNVISVVVVAMLFAVSLFYIGGTYARYSDEFSGNATGSIAAWKVKVGESETLNLSFTADETENVVGEKMAPGRTLTTTVDVDLTGTEVAVDIEVDTEATVSAIASAFGVSDDKVSVTVDATNAGVKNGDGSYTVKLSGGAAFTGDTNPKLTIKIAWENDDNNNADDTQVGEGESLTYSIPIKLTAQQHLSTDSHGA